MGNQIGRQPGIRKSILEAQTMLLATDLGELTQQVFHAVTDNQSFSSILASQTTASHIAARMISSHWCKEEVAICNIRTKYSQA